MEQPGDVCKFYCQGNSDAVQGECQGAFYVTRPWAVSPETGTVQVGGGTEEWPVQSY